MQKFRILNLTPGEQAEFEEQEGFVLGEVDKETSKKIHLYVSKVEKVIIFDRNEVEEIEE